MTDTQDLFIHEGLVGLPANARGCVIAIGNFDGLHLGHQALIGVAAQQAEALNCPLGVLSFTPHPRAFFQPDQAPFGLLSPELKRAKLADLGVQHFFLQAFDQGFAALSPEAFIADVLQEELAVRHVVVGENFRFGRKRGGSIETLKAAGKELGFGVTAVGAVTDRDGTTYSSSKVRQALREGKTLAAARILGRYWEIAGPVEHGAKRGRELGFPTANVKLPPAILRPALGIYAVLVQIDGEKTWHPGAANLGISPMYGYEEPLLEAHLLGYSGDLYGKFLRVALVEYLRAEARFDSLEAFIAQMQSDCRTAEGILASLGQEGHWPLPL